MRTRVAPGLRGDRPQQERRAYAGGVEHRRKVRRRKLAAGQPQRHRGKAARNAGEVLGKAVARGAQHPLRPVEQRRCAARGEAGDGGEQRLGLVRFGDRVDDEVMGGQRGARLRQLLRVDIPGVDGVGGAVEHVFEWQVRLPVARLLEDEQAAVCRRDRGLRGVDAADRQRHTLMGESEVALAGDLRQLEDREMRVEPLRIARSRRAVAGERRRGLTGAPQQRAEADAGVDMVAVERQGALELRPRLDVAADLGQDGGAVAAQHREARRRVDQPVEEGERLRRASGAVRGEGVEVDVAQQLRDRPGVIAAYHCTIPRPPSDDRVGPVIAPDR